LGKPDPLAAALAAVEVVREGRKLQVDIIFGDRPEVLEGIKAAHRRGISPDRIATTLSQEQRVSAGAVKNWLRVNG
jgi:hypothetical protein